VQTGVSAIAQRVMTPLLRPRGPPASGGGDKACPPCCANAWAVPVVHRRSRAARPRGLVRAARARAGRAAARGGARRGHGDAPRWSFRATGCTVTGTCPSRERPLLGQLAILDAVRLHRVGAEPALLVLFVGLEVAFEPDHLAVALEGDDVRGDAIE